MSVAKTIQLIRMIHPDSREADLANRIQRFNAIAAKNKEASNVTGKNQDYRQGYNIGEYLAAEGEEEYDFKDLDQVGNELLEETDWAELPVGDAQAFKDGIAAGYTITSITEEDEE